MQSINSQEACDLNDLCVNENVMRNIINKDYLLVEFLSRAFFAFLPNGKYLREIKDYGNTRWPSNPEEKLLAIHGHSKFWITLLGDVEMEVIEMEEQNDRLRIRVGCRLFRCAKKIPREICSLIAQYCI